jgi:SAM-dependent methyltransferase
MSDSQEHPEPPHARTGQSVSRPLFARVLLPRFTAAAMAHGQGAHRQRLLSALSGRVLEVGAGAGLNFAYYPPSVTEVVAVEPEVHLRAQAVQKAATAPVPIRVVAGSADHLPLEDASVDAAVASLVLCSVPDQRRALAELFRVVRPGGELRFYEHVRAPTPALVAVQRAIEPLWSCLGGGCHLTRQTKAAIVEAGFVIERIERFAFAPCLLGRLAASHILGSGRRP